MKQNERPPFDEEAYRTKGNLTMLLWLAGLVIAALLIMLIRGS
jgi:hypothetical protein